MVMAVNEGALKQGVDESMQTKLQILRQRRQLLEERLNHKNNELKNLCIAEAELTGVLPAEIPLEPGESPPILRRRVVLPLNASVTQRITKVNNPEADDLELERQIQIGLAEAALRIINDLSENRAIRRKQRSVYQQCQRKLQELDARLNFIRQQSSLRQSNVSGPATAHLQNYVQSSNKHRMKKPRPPLTGSLRDSYAKPLHEQGGVSLSPQEPEHYSREHYDACCQMTPPSANSHSYYSNPMERVVKLSEHEQNINNNIYIQPDQFRCRTLSQGSQQQQQQQQRNTSPRGQARYHEERLHHRPLTNSFSKDDRQIVFRYYHDETDNNVQKLGPHYRYMENQVQQQRINQMQQMSEELYPSSQKQQYSPSFEYKSAAHDAMTTPPAILRQRREPDTISEGRAQGSPRYRTIDNSVGYYVRHNGDIIWCPEDKETDKFGSLDRRKQHTNSQNVPPGIIQSGFRSGVAVSSTTKNTIRPSQMTSQNQMPLEQQQPVVASNRILRTQSLGSVESRQSNRESPLGKADNNAIDSARRKEKGWYETSLDSSCSQAPVLRPSNSIGAAERHYNNTTTSNTRKDPELPYRSRPAAPEPHPELDSPPIPHIVNRYYDSPKVLEIPAESKPLQYQENNAEITIPLNSPSNHTVVQPGKYQPYREVTKPFEMSDFYKYSTKYRKRNEANQMAAALTTLGNEAATENKPPPPTCKPSDQFYDTS